MSRKMMKLSALCASLTLAAAIAGCGTSNKEGAISLDSVAKVDEALCAQCHGAAIETLSGDEIYENYTESVHALKAVGCQDCHGGGAQHNGIGPIPYAKPNDEQCKSCHDDDGLVTKYQASAHKNAEMEDGEEKCNRCHTHQGAVLSAKFHFTGDKTVMDAKVNAPGAIAEPEPIKCNTCHETHKPQDLRIDSAWNPSTTVGGVTTGGDGYDQFRLCTQCHTYTDATGKLAASGTAPTTKFYHNTAWYRIIGTTHYDNPATPAVVEGYNLRTTGPDNSDPCFDCHGHESKTNTRPGRDATIHTDWANSAHGGKLLYAKYSTATANPVTASRTGNPTLYASQGVAQVDAVRAAGSIDNPNANNGAPGWTHYSWDKTLKADGSDADSDPDKDRADCQRCHTATGLSNYLSAPTTYNPLNNDFSHLSGWTAMAGSGQNELLYCWGCHSNAGNGTLRNPGAITENYAAIINSTTGTTGTAATVTYPDAKGSNVCMSCHLGREVGQNITNTTDADGDLGFINSHYLAAGGTLFGTTGYEFADRDYVNRSSFKHDKIGSADAPGTGSNGPCVGCHMTTPNSHKFTNVTKNAAGEITAITSTACVTCHSGNYALTPEALTTEEEEYVAALDALKATLASKGIYFHNAHPYFYNGANGTGGAFTNWAGVYGLTEWKNSMGAAFNFNLLEHDPGGYAHNRYYAKRLIWDSIDYIYDGTLNHDVVEAIDAQVTAARLDAAVAAEAKTYLGTARR